MCITPKGATSLNASTDKIVYVIYSVNVDLAERVTSLNASKDGAVSYVTCLVNVEMPCFTYLVNVDPAVVICRVLECGGENIRRPPLRGIVQLGEATARPNNDFAETDDGTPQHVSREVSIGTHGKHTTWYHSSN